VPRRGARPRVHDMPAQRPRATSGTATEGACRGPCEAGVPRSQGQSPEGFQGSSVFAELLPRPVSYYLRRSLPAAHAGLGCHRRRCVMPQPAASRSALVNGPWYLTSPTGGYAVSCLGAAQQVNDRPRGWLTAGPPGETPPAHFPMLRARMGLSTADSGLRCVHGRAAGADGTGSRIAHDPSPVAPGRRGARRRQKRLRSHVGAGCPIDPELSAGAWRARLNGNEHGSAFARS
jgi:hypothetical protein